MPQTGLKQQNVLPGASHAKSFPRPADASQPICSEEGARYLLPSKRESSRVQILRATLSSERGASGQK
jgi:hypothetical protein